MPTYTFRRGADTYDLNSPTDLTPDQLRAVGARFAARKPAGPVDPRIQSANDLEAHAAELDKLPPRPVSMFEGLGDAAALPFEAASYPFDKLANASLGIRSNAPGANQLGVVPSASLGVDAILPDEVGNTSAVAPVVGELPAWAALIPGMQPAFAGKALGYAERAAMAAGMSPETAVLPRRLARKALGVGLGVLTNPATAAGGLGAIKGLQGTGTAVDAGMAGLGVIQGATQAAHGVDQVANAPTWQGQVEGAADVVLGAGQGYLGYKGATARPRVPGEPTLPQQLEVDPTAWDSPESTAARLNAAAQAEQAPPVFQGDTQDALWRAGLLPESEQPQAGLGMWPLAEEGVPTHEALPSEGQAISIPPTAEDTWQAYDEARRRDTMRQPEPVDPQQLDVPVVPQIGERAALPPVDIQRGKAVGSNVEILPLRSGETSGEAPPVDVIRGPAPPPPAQGSLALEPVPFNPRDYPITPEQSALAEQLSRDPNLSDETVAAAMPGASYEDVLTVTTDAHRRAAARIAGTEFVGRMREKHGDVESVDPRANGVETVQGEDGNHEFVQRHEGQVVGASMSVAGTRGMMGGGEVVGSPVSARPLYEAMNALGVKPSKALSPYGKDAQGAQASGQVPAGPEAQSGRSQEPAPEASPARARGGRGKPSAQEGVAQRAAQQSSDPITRDADTALLALVESLRDKKLIQKKGLTYATTRAAEMRDPSQVIGRQGSKRAASALVDEHLPSLSGTKPETIANAILKDGDSETYRNALEDMREQVAEHAAEHSDSAEPAGAADASFNPDEFEPPAPTQPKEGQMVLASPREMLQPTEARTTEGREANGPLFTQETDARARAAEKSQGKLLDVEPTKAPLQAEADAARARIARRNATKRGSLNSVVGGIPGLAGDLQDWSILGAHHIARGAKNLGEFTAALEKSLGKKIDPELAKLVYAHSQSFMRGGVALPDGPQPEIPGQESNPPRSDLPQAEEIVNESLPRPLARLTESIARSGPVGKEIATTIANRAADLETWAADSHSQFSRALEEYSGKSMSLADLEGRTKNGKALYERFAADVEPLIESNAPLPDSPAGKMVGEVRALMNDWRTRLEEQGVKPDDGWHDEGHWPRMPKDPSEYTPEARARRMAAESDGQLTPEQALEKLSKTGAPPWRRALVTREGNIDLARNDVMTDWRRDPSVVFEYIHEAARRAADQKYFGQNGVRVEGLLRQMRLENPELAQYARTGLTRLAGHELPTAMHAASAGARQAVSGTALVTAPFAQAGSIVNTIAFTGVHRTAAGIWNTFAKGADGAGSISTFLENFHRAQRENTGALYPSLAQEMSAEFGIGKKETKQLSSKIAAGIGKLPYIRAINLTDGMERVVASEAARSMLPSLLEQAKKGDRAARGKFKQVGVDWQRLDMSKPSDVDFFAKKVADYTQHRTDVANSPLWSSHPLGKLVGMFKNFGYQQSRFMARMGNNPGGTSALFKLAAAGAIVGEGVRDLKDSARGYGIKGEDSDSWEEAWKKAKAGGRVSMKHPIIRIAQNMAVAGAFGLADDLINKWDQKGTAVSLALGPVGDATINQADRVKDKLQTKGAGAAAKEAAAVGMRYTIPLVGREAAREFTRDPKLGPNPRPGWVGHAVDVAQGKETIGQALERGFISGEASPERMEVRAKEGADARKSKANAELKVMRKEAELENPRSYDTKLTPKEEREFMGWKQKYAPRDSGADYDLRGAFKAGLTPDPKTGHWPDTFKKPNHPTFSVESQYAVGKDKNKAGRWEGETFIPPSETSAREAEYRLKVAQAYKAARKSGRFDPVQDVLEDAEKHGVHFSRGSLIELARSLEGGAAQ